jgi:hypothetical protein
MPRARRTRGIRRRARLFLEMYDVFFNDQAALNDEALVDMAPIWVSMFLGSSLSLYLALWIAFSGRLQKRI